MMNDKWVRAAMTDDRVVVELLVRLKQAQAAKPRPQAVIPLRWGLRLPRSKPPTAPAASVRCDIVSRRKDGDSPARCSPTTPLSWSGGGGAASPSATADGFEETSRRVSRSPPGFRSKGTANTETSCTTTTTTKRSRRKKTFSELIEEEGLLLKERMCLKKELATLNATFKEQTARNDNLKRIKLDLNLQYAKLSNLASDELETICIQRNQRECSSPNHVSSTLPLQAKGDDDMQSGSCDTHEDVSNHDRSFLLPDLNIMLSEEDPRTETLSGMR